MLRLIKNLLSLYKYRVLIQNLVSRELKARYRGTILGSSGPSSTRSSL